MFMLGGADIFMHALLKEDRQHRTHRYPQALDMRDEHFHSGQAVNSEMEIAVIAEGLFGIARMVHRLEDVLYLYQPFNIFAGSALRRQSRGQALKRQPDRAHLHVARQGHARYGYKTPGMQFEAVLADEP